MRRVRAVDVEARVGLGVAQILGSLHAGLVWFAALLHLGQDEVAGPVHDAEQRVDPVGAKALAQRPQHRNGSPHAALEGDRGPLGGGQREDLFAVLGEQGLVRGHHALAGIERSQHDGPGNSRAADQLHHEVDPGVVDDLAPLTGEPVVGQRDPPVPVEVDVCDRGELQRKAQALRDAGTALLEDVKHPAPDGAQSD